MTKISAIILFLKNLFYFIKKISNGLAFRTNSFVGIGSKHDSFYWLPRWKYVIKTRFDQWKRFVSNWHLQSYEQRIETEKIIDVFLFLLLN